MFFERGATVFANLLIGCGHNRARLRDKLAHMMDDFANLQIEVMGIYKCSSYLEFRNNLYNCFSHRRKKLTIIFTPCVCKWMGCGNMEIVLERGCFVTLAST